MKDKDKKPIDVGSLVLFLSIFILLLSCGGYLISTYFPPSVRNLSEKQYVYREIATNIDTVFVGSSHVYRQIDPLLFDKAMSAQGCESTSFNFGLSAGSLLEINTILREIINLSEHDDIRLIIEPRLYSLNKRNFDSSRFIESLDFQNLSLLPSEVHKLVKDETSHL